jgi:hypothetical protein
MKRYSYEVENHYAFWNRETFPELNLYSSYLSISKMMYYTRKLCKIKRKCNAELYKMISWNTEVWLKRLNEPELLVETKPYVEFKEPAGENQQSLDESQLAE